MQSYIEYEIEDGITILIKSSSIEENGLVKASSGSDDVVVVKAEKKFGDALDSVHKSANTIKRKLEDLKADEVEVKFGLITTGKLGSFAIGEIGVEANYEITLKWKNPPQPVKSLDTK